MLHFLPWAGQIAKGLHRDFAAVPAARERCAGRITASYGSFPVLSRCGGGLDVCLNRPYDEVAIWIAAASPVFKFFIAC